MPGYFGGRAQPTQNEGNMATAKSKAAQSTAPDTAAAPAATDETTTTTGEVAQTGAEPAQDNAPETPKADEPAAQPTQNEGNQSPAAPLPESVKLASPYGFINDETGEHRYWQAGQEVTDPDEIKLLVERQAPLE